MKNRCALLLSLCGLSLLVSASDNETRIDPCLENHPGEYYVYKHCEPYPRLTLGQLGAPSEILVISNDTVTSCSADLCSIFVNHGEKITLVNQSYTPGDEISWQFCKQDHNRPNVCHLSIMRDSYAGTERRSSN